MKLATQIQLDLLNRGFYIRSADDIPNGERFTLGVGVVISVYDNGTVLVQGKVKPQYAKSLRTLARILPTGTRWRNT